MLPAPVPTEESRIFTGDKFTKACIAAVGETSPGSSYISQRVRM